MKASDLAEAIQCAALAGWLGNEWIKPCASISIYGDVLVFHTKPEGEKGDECFDIKICKVKG